MGLKFLMVFLFSLGAPHAPLVPVGIRALLASRKRTTIRKTEPGEDVNGQYCHAYSNHHDSSTHASFLGVYGPRDRGNEQEAADAVAQLGRRHRQCPPVLGLPPALAVAGRYRLAL